jgi:hypothetical protein
MLRVRIYKQPLKIIQLVNHPYAALEKQNGALDTHDNALFRMSLFGLVGNIFLLF